MASDLSSITLFGWITIGIIIIVAIVLLQQLKWNGTPLGTIMIEAISSFLAALIGGLANIVSALIKQSTKSIQTAFLSMLGGIIVLAWMIGAFWADPPATLDASFSLDIIPALFTWFVSAVGLGMGVMGNFIVSGLSGLWPF